jgi:hypothetical protein
MAMNLVATLECRLVLHKLPPVTRNLLRLRWRDGEEHDHERESEEMALWCAFGVFYAKQVDVV